MKMLDDVRDRRYCELFVVKREGVRLSADVYNTLGLNDCPQAAWDAIDTAKVASQFGAFRVIRNGPRHFIMDRLASGDVTWMREQGMFDPARLVFLDETATSTNMVRLRGRCPRGQRLIAHVPHGHWKTITFVAGLRRRAVVAPLVLDGPMNATIFVTYLKECLAPKLKRGDVVIMDNLPVHRVAAVREVIEEAGAKLRYLPKYSPDLNPIEQAFSKLKAHLRKAAERTIPRLSRRIATLVAAFSRQECTNYFRYAGYASR